MAAREDLRVQKTKKALIDAFMNLLASRAFDEITVNELCAAAGIRRATFYKHYKDKYDFVASVTKALRDRFDSTVWKDKEYSTTAEYYVAYAKRLVGFISENESAINNILNSSLFPTIISLILEQNYADTKERLERSMRGGLTLAASVEVVAGMCAGGVASAIYSWIAEGRKKDPDLLAAEIGEIIKKIIEN